MPTVFSLPYPLSLFACTLQCAEALGAIADPSVLEVLEAFCSDGSAEVAETCSIAVRRVKDVLERSAAGEEGAEKKDEANPYESVDPAPAKRVITREEVPAFAAQLLDTSLPLFERYKAMFSLRNAGSKSAVLALCAGFADASPLFRHEVAYVLGQLQHAASVPALKARTQDPGEHEMVRHEAAEALGAIGNSECVEFLKAYTGQECPVMLRESCTVALDAADYWSAAPTAVEGVGGGGEQEGGKE
jgi:deoxyhypusine monooxygenase